MIVRIFPPAASFDGVRYNTDKIDRDKGELMKVSGFGPLQGLRGLRPEDYVNYLQMLSAQNKAVSKPQFHAVISAKGKSYDKIALTEIAEQWLTTMGYKQQPYLIVFHKDTNNNHVHLVSSRVDKKGRKIPGDFEHNRGIRCLNKIVGLDAQESVRKDIDQALSYAFSTRAQFMMILESRGYIVQEKANELRIIKFGQFLGNVSLTSLDERLKHADFPKGRIAQLRALFTKYGSVYDPALSPEVATLPGGRTQEVKRYSSALAACLKEKLGLQLLFHAKEGKPPYGYTIIDQVGKSVWKGSEIMTLKELLSLQGKSQFNKTEAFSGKVKPVPVPVPDEQSTDYYGALLRAALYNYPDLVQGLHHQGLEISEQNGRSVLTDRETGTSVPVDILLTDLDMTSFAEAQQCLKPQTDSYIAPVSISLDIDDEAINGRNRRRKKKARSNSR